MSRWLVGWIAIVALPVAAHAELRCEGRLFGVGASMAEVYDACGPPQSRVRGDRVLPAGLWDSPYGGEERIPIEVWTYDSPGQFSRKVVFENGALYQVQSGGYADLD